MMSVEKVKEYLAAYHLDGKVMVRPDSVATVEEAARELGVEEARIAKTMAFQGEGAAKAIIIVAAGDMKVSSSKFKQAFHIKAHMLDREKLLSLTGHPQGGVCPFALDEDVCTVYLDKSLERFTTVFPSCGSEESCIELTLPELEATSRSKGWLDLCNPILTTP